MDDADPPDKSREPHADLLLARGHRGTREEIPLATLLATLLAAPKAALVKALLMVWVLISSVFMVSRMGHLLVCACVVCCWEKFDWL